MSVSLAIVGDCSIGKTVLLHHLQTGLYDGALPPTPQVSFHSAVLGAEGEAINFELWDIPGSTNYKTIVPCFLRNRDILLVAFAVDSRQSFDSLGRWLESGAQHAPGAAILLVGLKADLRGAAPAVTREQADAFARESGRQFLEVSVKTGAGCEHLRQWLAERGGEIVRTKSQAGVQIGDAGSGTACC
jgi:small GTP-binding protein